MKKKEIRLNNIISMIREQPSLSIKELANVLNVSEMTIRRDFAYLKSSGILSQALGLNFISDTPTPPQTGNIPLNYSFHYELNKNASAKERIARQAANLISPRDIIILDSSTTVSKMIPYIPSDFPLTVISNNYHIISQLCRNESVNLIAVGGVYNRSLEMFESEEGIQLIRAHRANKYFFSSSGVHKHLGMTCSYSYEVLTKRASLESSATKIFLADSSKFDVVVTSYFGKLTDCDIIITDNNLSPQWKTLIENMGIKLYIV